MKRSALFSLLAFSILVGAERPYELGVSLGSTSIKNEPNMKFRNTTMGVNLQLNEYRFKPRFDFEYVDISSKEEETPTSLLKVSGNGLYEFNTNNIAYPYMLAGVGYESVTDERTGFKSHPFMQGGGGLGIKVTDKIKAKAELKALQILGGDEESNEFIATVGLVMPFGVSSGAGFVEDLIDSDNDGVMDRLDKCPNTPRGSRVDGAGCPLSSKSFSGDECEIKISAPDMDRDGVENSMDQCPNTPCDFSVDSKGCPIKAILRIHFATDSDEITEYSMQKVKSFGEFLITHKGSLVHIIGHTDSRADDNYNMMLSKSRAIAVREALIDMGVSASRLSTEGRGEKDPVSTNRTEEGMALNRRIEVELTYPQYINAGRR
jgi:OOP family OmpA-OmpF porin